MKVTQFVRVSVLGIVILAGGSAAVAQQGIPAGDLNALPVTVRINSPGNGTAVGRTVTVSGTAKPGVGLNLAIDGLTYVDPRDRGLAAGRGASVPATADSGGRFSFTADLSGPNVTVNSQGAFSGVSAGTHQFVVFELYASGAGKSQAVSLNVDGAGGNANPAAAASPIPTPTPSVSPSPSAGPTAVKAAVSFSDVLPILIAALLGGLAGYGGYRFRHRQR